MPEVLILMGSDSDAPVMQAAVDTLKEFGISSEMTVASAHRSPARVMRLVERGARPRRQALHRRRRRRRAPRRRGRRAHDPAGDRRADRFVGAEGDGRAARRRCRCRPACRWRRWRSASPARPTPRVLAAQILGVADKAMATEAGWTTRRSSRRRWSCRCQAARLTANTKFTKSQVQRRHFGVREVGGWRAR